MEYDFSKAMSSIHNITVALNEGGMLTCAGIAERIWSSATTEARASKVARASQEHLRNEDYAVRQVRQEVRRSLYTHFNTLEGDSYDIYRATAHGDSERFWVAEEQESMSPRVHEEEEDMVSDIIYCNSTPLRDADDVISSIIKSLDEVIHG